MSDLRIKTTPVLFSQNPVATWFQTARRAENVTSPGTTASIATWARIIAGRMENIALEKDRHISEIRSQAHVSDEMDLERVKLVREVRLLRLRARGLTSNDEEEVLETIHTVSKEGALLAMIEPAFPEEQRLALSLEIGRLSPHLEGALGLFPDVAEIQKLERRERELIALERYLLDQIPKAAEFIPREKVLQTAVDYLQLLRKREQTQKDLQALHQVMSSRIRILLASRIQDIETRLHEDEYGARISLSMAPRLLRYVNDCRKRLKVIDYKIRSHLDLSDSERLFLEKASAAIARTEATHGRDRVLEHLDCYFQMRDRGIDLRDRVNELAGHYDRAMKEWEKRCAGEGNDRPLHISEEPDLMALRQEYFLALETFLHLGGLAPKHWEGEVFPDMEYRREGDVLYIQPLGWKPNQKGLSRTAYWQLMIHDTFLGFPRLVDRMEKEFGKDFADRHYYALYMGWGHKTWVHSKTRIRLVGLPNLMRLGDELPFLLPGHDGREEDATLPAAFLEVGMPTAFLSDRRFHDRTFEPPTWGLAPLLLGPMIRRSHVRIDPADSGNAFRVMRSLPKRMRETGEAMIVFPEGALNPSQRKRAGRLWRLLAFFRNHVDRRDNQTMYGAMPGVALSLLKTDTPLVPVAIRNGAAIFPQQFLQDVVEGIGVGMTCEIKIGEAVRKKDLVPNNAGKKISVEDLTTGFVSWWNRTLSTMTGRTVGNQAVIEEPHFPLNDNPLFRRLVRQWNATIARRREDLRIRLPKVRPQTQPPTASN